MAGVNLPEDFADAATACLAFARERPDLLGWVIYSIFSSIA